MVFLIVLLLLVTSVGKNAFVLSHELCTHFLSLSFRSCRGLRYTLP